MQLPVAFQDSKEEDTRILVASLAVAASQVEEEASHKASSSQVEDTHRAAGGKDTVASEHWVAWAWIPCTWEGSRVDRLPWELLGVGPWQLGAFLEPWLDWHTWDILRKKHLYDGFDRFRWLALVLDREGGEILWPFCKSLVLLFDMNE